MRIPKQIQNILSKLQYNRTGSTILIVKLAGIGDVAMTCRAINDLFSGLQESVSLHWVIDGLYSSLAKSLLRLPKNITINFHEVNSKKLLSGTNKEKSIEAIKMLLEVAKVQPTAIALLHRDWRYKLFLRPAFLGPIFSIKRLQIHEVNLYKMELIKLMNRLHLSSNNQIPYKEVSNSFIQNSIGILLGGGSGTKTTFKEKRWPYFHQLISMLLKNSKYKIHLFGGKEDQEKYLDLINYLDQNNINKNNLISHIGTIELSNIGHEIKNTQIFISVDSGLAHIASCVMSNTNQKIISLFGPTDPKLWSPYDTDNKQVEVFYTREDCSPCYHNDGKFIPCKYKDERFQKCMKEIRPEIIFKAIQNYTERDNS